MARRAMTMALALALGVGVSSAALAQDALERMRNLQLGDGEFTFVEQSGEYADQIRQNLEQVKMPPGFEIELFAVVPDARHMAVGKNVGTVFVGTRKEDVWAITDRNKDRRADEVKNMAPAIDFKIPNGMCMSPDGFLYVMEVNRLLVFPAAEFFYENPDVAVDVVKESFIPTERESFNHGARVCTIGPDNKIYIAFGQPFNVPPVDDWPLGVLGTIQRMNRDGTGLEAYAEGVRNSVGIAFRPGTSELWFTDNQVDGMGDDIPPGEINRAPQAGLNFGFPYYGGGKVRTVEWEKEEPPADVVFPVVETVAHAADLGATFYTGKMFPSQYQGALFSAQHGSWNRTTPVGARVMVTFLDDEGNVTESKPFAEGWLVEESGEYLGRPVDVQQYLDGSLLVSDDLAGAVYRISYEGN